MLRGIYDGNEVVAGQGFVAWRPNFYIANHYPEGLRMGNGSFPTFQGS